MARPNAMTFICKYEYKNHGPDIWQGEKNKRVFVSTFCGPKSPVEFRDKPEGRDRKADVVLRKTLRIYGYSFH
jgi:hypothetical protein